MLRLSTVATTLCAFAVTCVSLQPNHHAMTKTLAQLFQATLALSVLLVIHLIHSTTLILALVVHLAQHAHYTFLESRNKSSTPSPFTLQQDHRRWKSHKLPKCLAVTFVPAARGHFQFAWKKPQPQPAAVSPSISSTFGRLVARLPIPQLHYTHWSQNVVKRGLVEDTMRLLRWCSVLGIEDLLLYDEQGTWPIQIANSKYRVES